jgi:hypothetical protein
MGRWGCIAIDGFVDVVVFICRVSIGDCFRAGQDFPVPGFEVFGPFLIRYRNRITLRSKTIYIFCSIVVRSQASVRYRNCSVITRFKCPWSSRETTKEAIRVPGRLLSTSPIVWPSGHEGRVNLGPRGREGSVFSVLGLRFGVVWYSGDGGVFSKKSLPDYSPISMVTLASL